MALRSYAPTAPLYVNRRTVPPAVEPLTIRELKQWLRITDDSEDELLAQMIRDAVSEIEENSGLALITQTWQQTMDDWQRITREPWWGGMRQGSITMIHGGAYCDSIEIGRYPLQSITSVTTYNESGTSTAVTVANVFDVDTQSYPGRLTLQVGQTWPVALRANNAIEIVYVAGFGAVSESVPDGLRRAVRLLAAYSYEHRGDGCAPGEAYRESGAEALVDRFRVRRI